MSSVQIDFWNLVMLLLAFFGGVFVFARALLVQIDKRLDARFTAAEVLRVESGKRWEDSFERIARLASETDKTVIELKLHVSENYVRREDHVRSQTVIEAKLDALASKFESLLLRAGILKEMKP